MGDGDDGAFVSASQAQCFELRLETTRGATSGVGELAQAAPNPGIALADASGLSFTGRLVVAGADTHPGGETVDRAEDLHVVANLDQQHGRADSVNTVDGLDQRQRGAVGRQLLQQVQVEAGDAMLQVLDMRHQFLQHKAMLGREIAFEGV